MNRTERKEFIEGCKRNANTAKDRLIDIMNNLRCEGVQANREADALEKIIIKLEVWQNK